MGLGAAVALVFPPAARLLSAARGMVVALVVWVVMQYVVLNLLDSVAFEGLIPWVFAVGHAVFGAMLGLVAAVGLKRPAPAR